MPVTFEPIGSLAVVAARARPELLADPVRAALASMPGADTVGVAEIDPDLADTAAFCERYGVRPDESANCVVLAARRQGAVTLAACVVLATTRADVNGVVRRELGARKVSFAPMAQAVEATGTAYGGITPVGLPEGWPLLVDAAVAARPRVVVGSGVRGSKLVCAGAFLATLPGATVVEGLAR